MQAPTVLVTSRQVQNVHTGLDLSVPQHQEVRGKMLSGHVEYQILVVTRLAAFKSAKHKPEDAVQFLVSKKYSEIEEFYQKLSSRYTTTSLPPLPRKVLFVGESDIRERRAMFSEILRCVAEDVQLAGSPELLEFLGTRSPGAAGLTSRDSSALDDTGSQAGDSEEAFDFFEQQDQVASVGLPILGQRSKTGEKSLEEEEEEEEELDPLGILRPTWSLLRWMCVCAWALVLSTQPCGLSCISLPQTHLPLGFPMSQYKWLLYPLTSSKKPKKCPEVAVKAKPPPRLTIFDEEEDPDEELFGPGRRLSPKSPSRGAPPVDSLKLFDDPDLGGAVALGDPLLLPASCEHGRLSSSLGHKETADELFRVEEDLDQILNLGAEPKPKPQPKPKPKPKPPVAEKPALPRKPAMAPRAGPSEAEVAQQKQQQRIQAMDEMDILQYIRDHDAPAQASPSLF